MAEVRDAPVCLWSMHGAITGSMDVKQWCSCAKASACEPLPPTIATDKDEPQREPTAMIPFFRRSAPADKLSQALQQIASPDSGGSALQPEPVPVPKADRSERRSILQNLFQSDDMITLPNNTTVDIPGDGKRAVRLYAQSLAGEDSLTESTNSTYCRINELVSYNWQPQSRVNLLAVHRTKPLIAYVINTMYHKAFVTGKQVPAKPEDQTVRLINYENNCRALCTPIAEAPIADIAFSFDSPKRTNSNVIAVIDRSGIINLLSFTSCTFSNAPAQLALTRFLTIRPVANICPLSEFVHLSWCIFIPGVDEDDEPAVDPSLRLVVTSGTSLEVFSFNEFHLRENGLEVGRSHFKSDLGEYYFSPNIHKKDIVSAAISNDGSLTCTASLSNMLLFYSIDDSENRLQYLREWSPPLAAEQISHSFFLDDIDHLVQNPHQMFWGYLFVGTSSGHMQIYDLQDKEWSVIQDLHIIGEDSSAAGTGFSYHADKSSKVILAVRHHSAFVFLLQFSEKGEGSRIPVMKQVSRLQLYNDVISIQVKQTSENEIEIFCITLKNLQRLTIDITDMNESKLPVSKPHSRPAPDSAPSSLAKALIKDRKLSQPSQKEQELLDKLQEKSKELISMKQKQDPAHAPVSVSPASVSGPDYVARTRSAVTAAPAPAVDPMSSILDKLSNGQPQKTKLPQTPSFSPAAPSPALNDMAKIMLIDDKLKTFESRFTKQMEVLAGTVAAGFKTVHSEVGQLKQELQQQPAKQAVDRSLVELTISKAVDQCMKQMNVVVSKGLKDFFDQTDVAISELQATVVQSNTDLKSSFSETQSQLASVKSKMDVFEMQMERLDAQQQLLLFRYQQLINQSE